MRRTLPAALRCSVHNNHLNRRDNEALHKLLEEEAFQPQAQPPPTQKPRAKAMEMVFGRPLQQPAAKTTTAAMHYVPIHDTCYSERSVSSDESHSENGAYLARQSLDKIPSKSVALQSEEEVPQKVTIVI